MRVTKKDLLIFVALTLLCGALCALVFSGVFAESGETVTVYQAGKQMASYPLTQDREITLTENAYLRFRIEGGTVFVIESDCPGQDCVRTPPISKAGQSILCAPQQVLLKITYENSPDAVVS